MGNVLPGTSNGRDRANPFSALLKKRIGVHKLGFVFSWTRKGESVSGNDERYARQDGLVDHSVWHKKRVVFIGGGSIGHPSLELMARHGVGTNGRIWLIDGDEVNPRNLLSTYSERHLGLAKVEAQLEILTGIDSRFRERVTLWNKMLDRDDIQHVVKIAGNADLLCLFADDLPLMMEISDATHAIVPQVMAVCGETCDVAEIAFSTPKTVQLSRIMGKRERQRIEKPKALGVDTITVAAYAASVALRLLLGDGKGSEFLAPCHSNAPLFIQQFRRVGMFENFPDDIVRSTVIVGVSDESPH